MKKLFIILLLVFLVSCSNDNVIKRAEDSQKNILVKNDKIEKNEKKVQIQEKNDNNISDINIGESNNEDFLTMMNNKEYNKAEKILKDKLKIERKSLYITTLAEIYINKGKYKEAEKLLLEANELDKGKDVNTFIALAVIYGNLGDTIKAKKYINLALELDSKNQQALDFLKNLEKNEK